MLLKLVVLGTAGSRHFDKVIGHLVGDPSIHPSIESINQSTTLYFTWHDQLSGSCLAR